MRLALEDYNQHARLLVAVWLSERMDAFCIGFKGMQAS